MAATAPTRERLLTIGTVCRRLKAEFKDISISKIRYLEDQGLLTPKRTQGGYRLFSEDDVDTLETILRLQRDEFLPLRVIREELAAGAGEKRRRRRAALGEAEEGLDLDMLCDRAGIEPGRARELEDFGLLEPRVERGSVFRNGRRHRRRLRHARPLRDRPASPACIPHRCGSRDRPARGGCRAGIARAHTGTPPRGDRRPPGDGGVRERALPAPLRAERP